MCVAAVVDGAQLVAQLAGVLSKEHCTACIAVQCMHVEGMV